MNDLFDFEPKPLRFAVFGNPIAHSKSPRVHSLFAKQFGINLEYRAVQVDTGGFEQAVSAFQANGGQGLNITVPFKVNAWNFADQLSERANLAGAANTLVLSDSVYGDNTDGIGLVTDIVSNLGVEIRSRNILVIGAGGAARGIVGPIVDEQPASLTIVNRTVDKAVALAEQFARGVQVCGGGLTDACNSKYDIIIHSTSAALADVLPEISSEIFSGVQLAYDLMYSDGPTRFQNWAMKNGVKLATDGLGMLIEQAAESFAIWHKQRPETRSVIETIRKEL